ncbi:MAG TPA: MBL fold metallo-hydrolase [Pseudomonadales bacterium]|nr:MBL fold metallo-hydrolase [Pseudomonadales bacterium]
MNRWQIGAVKITRIVELEVTGGSRFILPQATRDAVKHMQWMKPHFMDDEGNLVMSVHALVVETAGRRIIVDTCIGNDKERAIPAWNKLQLPFLDDLKAAGYDRMDIDTVLCTHLHVDHVGWNTMLVDGKWIPTFPNARYLLDRAEFEYWDNEDTTADTTGNSNQDIMADSVRPVFDAGLIELVDSNYRICDELCLVPTPGHTPGHVSVYIESEGQRALITGDALHHPCQFARPDWSSPADYDQDASRKTRMAMIEDYGDDDILVIGTHFSTPTAGHIRSGDDGYWFDVS